ncbi:MAG: hypothetical protein RJQ09_02790 [Cyclobacteriaceae bacterium]
MHEYPHPGKTLQELLMHTAGYSVEDIVKQTNLTTEEIRSVLNGESDVTMRVAEALAPLIGLQPLVIIGMQNDYDMQLISKS